MQKLQAITPDKRLKTLEIDNLRYLLTPDKNWSLHEHWQKVSGWLEKDQRGQSHSKIMFELRQTHN